MGFTIAAAILRGPRVSFDGVRSELWLPRKPSDVIAFEYVMDGERSSDHFAIHRYEEKVLVFGWPIWDVDSEVWERLSGEGGLVVVLSLAENFAGNSYTIYDDGEWCRSWVEPDAASDGEPFDGEPHALDPAETDAHPADVVSKVYAAVLGIDPYTHLLDRELETEMQVWRVEKA